jgi:hypothetical protein
MNSKLSIMDSLDYRYHLPEAHEGPDSVLGRRSRIVIYSDGSPSEEKKRVTKNISTDMEHRARNDPALFHHFNAVGVVEDFYNPHKLVRPSYGLVNKHIYSWAESAGDGVPRSLALQMAAQHHWGLPDETMAHIGQYVSDRRALEKARYYYQFHHVFLHHFLDSVYQATQEHLKDTPELLVHRGHNFSSKDEVPDWGKPKEVDKLSDHDFRDSDINEVWDGPPHQSAEFSSQPLSSWSTNKHTAHSFGESPYGHVLTSVVPRKHVWSTAHTGPGCLNEQEIITIGGHGHAYQTFSSPTHWRSDS